MSVIVYSHALWRFSKSLVIYLTVFLIAICALWGAMSILGLFFLGFEQTCVGVNAYQIGDKCYYE